MSTPNSKGRTAREVEDDLATLGNEMAVALAEANAAAARMRLHRDRNAVAFTAAEQDFHTALRRYGVLDRRREERQAEQHTLRHIEPETEEQT